ncbi:hypothetical protein AYI69_g6401 [Smittium culicis]|uniref:Nuclear pore complex protein Nup85 n=1 Tax=Smittium culicis TaxID=133412 RepID=A0A1R1XZ66_9FUNG|nr:hypothetical protein AYI69_g6401 [Smittium culicis]
MDCYGFYEAASKLVNLFRISILDQHNYLLDLNIVSQSELERLQAIHMIWSLMEILFNSQYYIDDDVEASFKFNSLFSNWYIYNFPLDNSLPIESIIFRCILQGNLPVALQLLEEHHLSILSKNSSSFGFDQTTFQLYSSFIEFIKLHPVLCNSNGSNLNQFQFTQKRSILKMKALSFNNKDHFLYKACLIVVGNDQFLLEFSENWLEYLLASHLYIPEHELSYDSRFELAKKCYLDLGDCDNETNSLVESCLYSMLAANFGELFVHVSNFDFWLSAHLIFFYCGSGMCSEENLKM